MRVHVRNFLLITIVSMTAFAQSSNLYEKDKTATATGQQIMTRIFRSMSAQDKKAIGAIVVRSASLMKIGSGIAFTSLTPELQAELTSAVSGSWQPLGNIHPSVAKDTQVYLASFSVPERNELKKNHEKIVTVIEKYLSKEDLSKLGGL